MIGYFPASVYTLGYCVHNLKIIPGQGVHDSMKTLGPHDSERITPGPGIDGSDSERITPFQDEHHGEKDNSGSWRTRLERQ